MKAYYAFSDECGEYHKDRTLNSIQAHPFYVRSNMWISVDDYYTLQTTVELIKQKYGISVNQEVKWQHYGSKIKNNFKKLDDDTRRFMESVTLETLEKYFEEVIDCLSNLESVKLYFTVSDNASVPKVSDTMMLYMHLQNGLTMLQRDMNTFDGFATLFIDNLNNKNKAIRAACHELMLAGDFITYTRIRKSISIDDSKQCYGLQVADIVSGIFTASLKSIKLNNEERFAFAVKMMYSKVYKSVRTNDSHMPYYNTYRSGIKEVPQNTNNSEAKEIARQIDKLMERDINILLWPNGSSDE